MRRFVLVAVLLAAPALSLAQAPAASPPQDPTIHRHLGFFLRLDAGVGYLSSSASLNGNSASVSGFAIPFGVAIGGAVAENFILAGDIWGSTAVSPSVKLGGQSQTGNASATLTGVGLNFTYYFMPHNIYASVTPSLAWLSASDSYSSSSTQVGFGLKAGLGKEWWVGDHWGLGVAAQFVMGINADKQSIYGTPTWTTLGGALAFSATYN